MTEEQYIEENLTVALDSLDRVMLRIVERKTERDKANLSELNAIHKKLKTMLQRDYDANAQKNVKSYAEVAPPNHFEMSRWHQDNPGAFDFMGKLEIGCWIWKLPDSLFIAKKLKEYKSIRGTNMYVLYSDLCDRDFGKVYKLLKDCPKAILEDACSRQDYSGRELVAKYLPKEID